MNADFREGKGSPRAFFDFVPCANNDSRHASFEVALYRVSVVFEAIKTM